MSSEATAAVAAGATETTPSVPTATPATDGTTMVMTANASSNAFAVAPTTSSTTTPSTTTSVLPSPSMPLARSLSHVPCESVAAMSAMELLAAQLDCGAHGAHTEVAVDAIQRVAVVARTLGPIATRSTLLPYLTQMVVGGNIGSSGSVSTGTAGTTDAATATSISDAAANSAALLSDELLLLLGQELSHVIPLVVGGSSSPLEPNNSSAPDTEDSPATVALEFLPLLERLATTEETVVRDQAVIVLRDLCQRSCSNNNTTSAATTTSLGNNNSTSTTMTVISAWMAMVKRLAGADWFTSKVSCAGILPTVLLLCQDHVSHQLELLSIYKDVLCADETPMVRRAAAQNLGMALRYAGYAHHRDTLGAITPALLTHDEQDSVRLAAVAALAQAGPSYAEHPSWTIQHWLPILKDGSTDMSWRVRNNLAKNFSDVAAVLGIQGDSRYGSEQTLVMACFVAMLTDVEAEVRAASVGHLARMVAWGGPTLFASHLQPLLPALSDDVVMEVRSKCALSLMDAADAGTLDDAIILQFFGPLLEAFLQDEFHEVQLQVLSNLHKISRLLQSLPGVVSSLLQMSKATNSRVREAVAKLLPHLAEARGLDFFNTVLLEPAWLPLLLDTVASVRSSIVSCMALLVRVTGQDFILNTLLPLHIKIYNQHSNTYLIRMTILHAHIETAVVCKSGGLLWEEVVAQMLKGLADRVPNVRTVAAHGFARIVMEGDMAIVQTQIRPALEKRLQEEETDPDCRQACQEALDLIKY